MEVTVPKWDDSTEVVPTWESSSAVDTAEATPSFDDSVPADSPSLLVKAAETIKSAQDNLVGSGETLANLFSGFLTGGLAGAYALSRMRYEWITGGDPLRTFVDVYAASSEKWHKYTVYQPKTGAGQEQQAMVEDAFHWFDNKAKELGDVVFDKTGSPELATATYMGPHVALLFGPKVAKVASDKVSGVINKRKFEKLRDDYGYNEPLPPAKPELLKKDGTIDWEPQPEFKNPLSMDKDTFDVMYEKAYPKPKEEAALADWIVERDVNWNAYGRAEKFVGEQVYRTSQTNAIEGIRRDTNIELRNAEMFGKDAGFIPLAERAGNASQIPGPRDMTIPGMGVRPVLDTPGAKRVELKQSGDKFSLEEQAGVKAREKSPGFDEVWVREQEVNKAIADREYADAYRKAMDEELAYLERDTFLAEERINNVINNGFKELPKGQTRKGQFAPRQQGQMDITVYAEGLKKVAKDIDDFTTKLVAEYGASARAIAPLLWKATENSVKEAEPVVVTGKPTHPYKASPSVTRRVIEYIGGRSIAELERKAVDSPSFQKLLDDIEHPEWQPKQRQRVTGADLTEGRLLKLGELHSRFTDAITNIEKKFLSGPRTVLTGRIPKDLNDMAVKQLATGKGAYGRTARAAEQVRVLLDDVYKYAAEAGIDLKSYLQNYFPYVINVQRLAKTANKDAFTALLVKYGTDPIEARSLVNHIVTGDGIMADKIDLAFRNNLTREVLHGRDVKTRHQAKASPLEKSRQLLSKIPYEELKPFIQTDLNKVIPKYLDTVVRRVEIAKRFGPKYEKLADELFAARKELQSKGTDFTEWEIQRTFDMIDAYQHMYKPYPNAKAIGSERVLHTAMNIKTLGMVTISSLPELTIPYAWVGPRAYLPSVVRATLNEFNEGIRSVWKGAPKTEMEAFSEILMKATDIGSLERLTSMYNADVNMVNAAFFKVVGLQTWTKYTSIVAQESFRSMFSTMMGKLAKGKKLESYEMAMRTNTLRWFGMNEVDALAWYKKGMPKDDPMYYEYKKATLRFVHHSVPISRPAVRPMWHSNPHPLARSVAHLKGFPSLYGNTILKNMALQTMDELSAKGIYGASRRTMQIAGGIGMSMVLADLAWSLKDDIANRENKHQDLPWGKRVERNWEGIGGYGILNAIVMAAGAKDSYGGSFLGTLAGPGINAAEGFIEASYDMVGTKSTNRTMARWIVQNMVIPGQIYSKETRTAQYDAVENVLNNLSPEAKKSLMDDIRKQLQNAK